MAVEDDARGATLRFYDAIEDIIAGRGLDAMKAIWHHGDDVTTAHPTGDWARGWEQILASWEAFALLGAPENAGSKLTDLVVRVRGDMAYATGIFHVAPKFGGDRFNVTDILVNFGGAWKLVHHHADRSPSISAAIDDMITE